MISQEKTLKILVGSNITFLTRTRNYLNWIGRKEIAKEFIVTWKFNRLLYTGKIHYLMERRWYLTSNYYDIYFNKVYDDYYDKKITKKVLFEYFRKILALEIISKRPPAKQVAFPKPKGF